MAKKKKSTKKKNVDDLAMETSVLKKVLGHLNNTKVVDVVMVCKDSVLSIGGMDESDVSLTSVKLDNVVGNPFSIVYKREKLEKYLKTAKKEFVMNFSSGSKAVFKSGKGGYKLGLLPSEDYADTIEFIKNPTPQTSNNSVRFDIEPKDFEDVISMAKNLTFSENLYFESVDNGLKVSLLSNDDTDESYEDVDVLSSEVKGTPETISIHPKFIKSFEIFNEKFSLTLPTGVPINVESISKIGDHNMEVLVMIGPSGQSDEDDVLEETDYEDDVDDLDLGEEPEEELEFEE